MKQIDRKRKPLRITVFLIIILLQIMTVCYWAEKKSGFHIDELFSIGYAQAYNYHPGDAVYITFTNDWQYETWIDNSKLTEQLYLSEEESLLKTGLTGIVKKFLNVKHNYFVLLNLSMSLFSDGRPDIRPALILNLFFFVLSQLLIYRITSEITENSFLALMAILMYGFSLGAVGNLIFIRFYTYTILQFLAAVRLHQIMWRSGSLLKYECLTVLCISLLLNAMRNSELIFILSAGLAVSFLIGLCIKRQYVKIGAYLVTVIPAGLYYIIKETNYLEVIFHPERYLKTAGAERNVAKGLLEITVPDLMQRTRQQIRFICYQIFGSRYVFFGFILLLMILAGIRIFRQEKDPCEKTEKTGFSWILFSTTVIYLISAILGNLFIIRYVSFLFPIITILLWSLINYFSQKRNFQKACLLISSAMAVTGILIGETVNSNKLEYLYPNDRDLPRMVKETGIKNVVIIYEPTWGRYIQSSYDCIYLMPDDASVYIVSRAHHQIDTSETPDEMLIWVHRNPGPKYDIDMVTDELTANGYEITKLGRNHVSDVYTAIRKTGQE